MTKFTIIIMLIVLGIFSCKQKSNQISNETISIENIIQRYDDITQVSYYVSQVWKGPMPGSIDTSYGYCSFIPVKNDSLLGCHYLVTYKNWITNLYNGDIYVNADSKDKSAKIYNLNEYDVNKQLLIIKTPMLYMLSYDEIIKDLKERLKVSPVSIMVLEDTIIGKYSRYRIKTIDQDSVSNQLVIKQNIITFDKETFLPIFVNNITRTPGGVFEGQTIDIVFSQYEISTTPTNKTLDLSSIPFEIQKLAYSTDKQNIPLLKINDKAPLWNATLSSGDPIKSRDLEGKITLLNFTSVNCGYCIKAHEVLKRIDERYKGAKLSVISVFPIDKLNNINNLVTKSNIKHSIIYNAAQMQKDYLVTGFPTLFLVNQSGKIEYTSIGFSDNLEAELSNAINRLLANN